MICQYSHSSAISSIISAIFLFVPLQKEYQNLISKEMIIDLLKMSCSAVVMTIITILCRNGMMQLTIKGLIANIIVVAVPVAAGIVVYIAVCYILGVTETKQAVEMLKKRKEK